jgi:hypothetical protein
MIEFTLYDMATGIIEATGIVPDETSLNATMEARPGFGAIVGQRINARLYRIVNGEPVEWVREPDPVTVAEVKAEAERRLRVTDWMVIRASEGGAAVPPDVLSQRAAIRAASNALGAMSPIPTSYQDDIWWIE